MYVEELFCIIEHKEVTEQKESTSVSRYMCLHVYIHVHVVCKFLTIIVCLADSIKGCAA